MGGSSDWMRSVNGSPRIISLDMSGDIELTPEGTGGMYFHVALNNVIEAPGPVSLDNGSPYAACRNNITGVMTPEYKISQNKRILASECPVNNSFVDCDENDDSAFKAPIENTKTFCDESHKKDACLMKFHTYEDSN